MLSLIKKELLQFFGSMIAYLILVVFGLIAGMFLWFFDGNMNILNGGNASLSAFFDLAPWLYLFLIPAVTMRLFSEELKSGTMELLLTRPVSILQLIGSKLIAAFVIVMATVALSLVYFYTVYQLGHPVGVMDVAATFGSYLGLLFLALIFLAVGLFTSSMTENQIISFVLAVLLSFFLFSGFELIADLFSQNSISSFFLILGISSHYESISRGVLDSRDLFYFLSMATLFVLLTTISLNWRRGGYALRFNRFIPWIVVLLPMLLFIQLRLFRIDFSSEKRFSLSPVSIQVLNKIEQPILAELYLEGDMPPGFQRLRRAIEEKLTDIQQYGNNSIYIRKIDPYKEVPPKELKAYFDNLYKHGVIPTDIRIKTEQGITTKLLFPTVVLRMGERSQVLNLLKNDPALPAEENLNRSVEQLEYSFISAIETLSREEVIRIAFLTGHQEADSLQTYDLTASLSSGYEVQQLTCKQLQQAEKKPKVVIIANPQQKFAEADKLILDQFLMKGGKLVWLVDPVKVSLDSLSEGMTTLALPNDLNLGDQLYHYGVRMNNDLLQDAECMKIRVNTAPIGSSPNYSLAPWYFSPLLHPHNAHPIGKNVSPVASEFVSTLDTVGDHPDIKRTILLSSSPFSRKSETPLQVSLQLIDMVPTQKSFNRSNLITGILLEGKFGSVFKNRMVSELGWSQDQPLLTESAMTQMALFTDGGLLSNKVNRMTREPQISPLGFDRVTKITYGNKEFFTNLIHFMAGDERLMALRAKNWPLRLLDKVKLNSQATFYRWLNLLLPILLVLLGGLLFNWRRGKSYEKQTRQLSE